MPERGSLKNECTHQEIMQSSFQSLRNPANDDPDESTKSNRPLSGELPEQNEELVTGRRSLPSAEKDAQKKREALGATQHEVLQNFFQSLLSSRAKNDPDECARNNLIHHATFNEVPEQNQELFTVLLRSDGGKPDVRIGGVKVQSPGHPNIKSR